MKILIPIKRVNDYNVKVRPNQANTDVDLNNVKMAREFHMEQEH